MRRLLTDAQLAETAAQAAEAERRVRATWPGDVQPWQPRSTAYVPADAFSATTASQWAQEARRLLDRHAPDGPALVDRAGLVADEPDLLRARVDSVLSAGALDDVRIDFEDGYGARDDGEEDGHAAVAGRAVAAARTAGTLPRRYGVRTKSFADGLAARCLRTLDLFLCALLDANGGSLPPGLRITYPKVVTPEHVAAFTRMLDRVEEAAGLDHGALHVEVQVETPMSVVDAAGANALRGIVAAGGGRIRAAHLGVFDYTAALGLPPSEQRLDHPACDAARDAMQTALAGSGVELSDGATNHTPGDDAASELARVWRVHAAHVRHSLERGFVQGWDMHPAHLVSRAAAVVEHYLADLGSVCERVRAWSAEASSAAGVADEPATVAALLRHLRRAVAAGAVDADDIAARTGLPAAQLTTRAR